MEMKDETKKNEAYGIVFKSSLQMFSSFVSNLILR
jgi:hypothetical protein